MALDIGRKRKRLGDLLIAEGVITEETLSNALSEQKKRGTKLGETLIDLGYVDDEDIAKTLHNQLGIDNVNLSKMKIDESVVGLLSDNIVKKYTIMPVSFKNNNPNILIVAMADPLDILAIDDISIITNLQVEPVIATTRDIKITIDRYYGKAANMAVAERYTKERAESYNIESVEEDIYSEDVNRSPIVQLVNSIIEQAVRQRSSDIHIEPLEDEVRVRYRIDGVLIETMKYGSTVLSAIVARVKIIGDMDISEKRKPQDGRFSVSVDRQEYDIRVSILPTVYGEKIVMRLIFKGGLTKSKKMLGLSDDDMEKFDKILSNPNGIILVTGPTGSGKSTTLYTALSELNKADVNIITVEDPVEANIEGINQVQVNNKADLTFANALRSILRQDPDIIMIGEIRDGETAEIAVRASITGHLVVSTLHTNSAASSIARLEDMGIEPYLLADALEGIIAQRLVRRLCECKVQREAEDFEKTLLNINENEDITIYEPGSCHLCNGTGYRGRIGVYEILTVSQEIKKLISKKATTEEINKQALAEGMSTLSMSVCKYVLKGITSITEMKRITFE